jgi:hypothetical protein
MPNGTENARPTMGIHINELNIGRHAATVSGRPLFERSANPAFLRLLAAQEIHIGSTPTKYKDSRIGTRMNADAFETFRGGETQQLLDSFAWLREKYFAFTGEPSHEMTDHQLLNLSLIGEAIPLYIILRAENSIDRMKLPEVVGNISKASLGFRELARHNINLKKIHIYSSPDEVYEFADKNSLLHQQGTLEGFTCPAPESLITKTSNALLFGKGADAERSQLSDYISDEEFGNLVRFSRYNYQYANTIKITIGRKLSPLELYAIMIDLQNKMNIELGREPDSIPPPANTELEPLILAEIVTPDGGPVHTAKAETHSALVEIHKEKEALTRSKVIYRQRTINRDKRGKKRR